MKKIISFFALALHTVSCPAMAAPSDFAQQIFIQKGEGAVSRTPMDKLSDTVSVMDFGAVMSPTIDQSDKVNAAILAVFKDGGGIVTIPKGSIKMSNILIKKGVKLVGSGDIATTVVVTDRYHSAITMDAYAGLESMRIYYPEQVTAGVPIPYPPAITGGPSYATIRNIKFQGAYEGVVMGGKGIGVGSVLIDNLTGFPLHYGIKFDNNTDNVRINNVHFNHNIYGDYASSLLAWVYQHGVALTLLRADSPQVESFLALGYSEGIRLDTGTPSGAANMAKFNNIQLDICRTPLNILGHQDGVFFTNSIFTTGGANYHGVQGGVNNLAGGQTATRGVISFVNSSFRHYASSIAIIRSSVVFTNVQFDDYNVMAGNHPALKLDFPEVDLALIGSSVDGRNRPTTGGILSTDYKTSVRVIGTTFSGMTSYDGLLSNARLSLKGNAYSTGFTWNGVGGVTESGGEISTYQSPSTFGTIGPFKQGDRFSNAKKAVGAPKGWSRVAGSVETWISEGNL